ncbi:MAG TPA: CoA-binding protein [Phycisphaerae bacterium]|nr:CoA-binding protein [Phycisphaerae bacterium]HNU45629.1 CoA-binding protein [Phycisphaerae bacterium]
MNTTTKQTVAVVGASADRAKYSNKSVRAHLQEGWDVYPVNPKGGQIEGLRGWASLAEIPVRPDRVTLYLPPAAGIKLLPQIARAKPGEFFVNPGAESEELVAEAKRLGLDPLLPCSIAALGFTPAQLER